METIVETFTEILSSNPNAVHLTGKLVLQVRVGNGADLNGQECAGTTWTKCAGENQHCSFSGTKTVKYGHGTDWSTKTKTNGVQCSNGVFGDPKPGQVKECYYQ